ncbi:hypothetical protein DSO57_1025923 [Entomophthora muscae]|uniref:Uncharacterized protein n=1 Tax=Entomophthora muscae TaxID=34485 RepID=A0ACC2RT93_9FUNG|nr:hypothetical protein DSO57_1025923 [Entomophthora muscae]
MDLPTIKPTVNPKPASKPTKKTPCVVPMDVDDMEQDFSPMEMAEVQASAKKAPGPFLTKSKWNLETFTMADLSPNLPNQQTSLLIQRLIPVGWTISYEDCNYQCEGDCNFEIGAGETTLYKSK